MFEHRVVIVSKAGPKLADLTRQWLGRQGLVGAASIAPSAVYFVRKRPDKNVVCGRLDVTHFIDDRLDVLAHLATVEHPILFTDGLGRNPVPADIPRGIRAFAEWPRIVDWLRKPAAGTVDRRRGRAS